MHERTAGTIVADRTAAIVLAVDLDDLTLSRIKAVIKGTEFTVVSVSPERAVERAQAEDGPVIGLLEWTEEREAERTRLSDALRRATRPGHCHIVAIGTLSDPALARAMDGTVNDVLSRPFGGEVFLRLRQALRAMKSARAALTPLDALNEALASESGGEVAVRSGDVVGHIHVQHGGIVWANLSSVPATMEAVARYAGVDLGAEILDAAKAECRETRVHFMDVLVAWKLVEAEHAKEAVRKFVAERVQLVLDLPSASALFLPKARRHTEHLRLNADEIQSVIRAPLARSVTPFPTSELSSRAPLSLGDISLIFQEANRIEGVLGVAILDRKTGGSLLSSGTEIDTAIAWSQLSSLAALGPDAEDVMASAGAHCFVTRPLQVAPTLALFIVFLQSATTIGLARSLVAKISSTKAPISGAS